MTGARIMRKVNKVTSSVKRARSMRKEALRQSVQKAGRDVAEERLETSHMWGVGKGVQMPPAQRVRRPWSIRIVRDWEPVVIHVGRKIEVDVRTVAIARVS